MTSKAMLTAILLSTLVGCGAKHASSGSAVAPIDTMGSGSDSAMAGSGDMMAGSDAAAMAATTVSFVDRTGKAVGTATLSSDPKGVAIALDVMGLPAGVHAIHVHETGVCTAPDFKSAGGHLNPGHKMHGMENPQGPHAGDMPNFTVGADGTFKGTVVAPGVTYDHTETSVFGTGVTALVIHAKADDMKSDPAGNAGDRIACGVVEMK